MYTFISSYLIYRNIYILISYKFLMNKIKLFIVVIISFVMVMSVASGGIE